MRISEIDSMSAEQYFHIVGVLGSAMRQILPEGVELQRQQMVKARDARLHLAEDAFLGRFPHFPKSGVAHEHQVEAIPSGLSKLREHFRLTEQLQPACHCAFKPGIVVNAPDHEIDIESGPGISVRPHRPATDDQEAEGRRFVSDLDEVG